jgi:hypothetical protein
MIRRWFAACLAVAAAPLFAAGETLCTADKPMGGHVELRFRYTPEDHSRTARLRAWFDLIPEQERGRTYLAQRWRARNMTWRSESSPCSDRSDPANEKCGCARSENEGKASFAAADSKPEFFALAPELHVAIPADAAESLIVKDLRCEGPSSGSRGPNPLPLSDAYHVAPENPFELPTVLVSSSGCLDEDEQITPECAKAIRKFAVFPFSGNGDLDESPYLKTRIQWEVCCGCGEPPAADISGETDPCGDAKQQRGLLEVAVANSDRLREELRPRLQSYRDNMDQAANYRSDFVLVSNSCAGWDLTMTLLTALIGGAGAGKQLADAPQAVKSAQSAAAAFTQLLEIIEKVLDADPEVILSGVEGAEVDLLGIEGFTLGSLWGPASEIYQLLSDAKNETAITNMRSRLEDCAGTPLVSDLVFEDAERYLDSLDAATRELPQIQKLTTQIQQADITTYERWVAWYNACREEAQCRGTDPEECAPTPP